jgi:hypothetical protein
MDEQPFGRYVRQRRREMDLTQENCLLRRLCRHHCSQDRSGGCTPLGADC